MSNRYNIKANKPLEELHEDCLLMIPPPGFKFIPKSTRICGKAGCFECFDIYCQRCESKDRRIVELEMRNNDLVKYITQLQSKIFGGNSKNNVSGANLNFSGRNHTGSDSNIPPGKRLNPGISSVEPFGVIQSPPLYDPNMNLSYIATTTFSPASEVTQNVK